MARTDIVDLSESGRRAQALRRRRWVRIAVPVGFVLLLAVALSAILFYSHQANRREALALSDTVIQSTAMRIETEVVSYLTPARQAVELTAQRTGLSPQLLDSGLVAEVGGASSAVETPVTVDGPAPLALQAKGIDILQSNPQLAMVNLADASGSFVMPKKMPGGAIDTKIIDRRHQQPTVRWVRRNAAGQVEGIENVEYDGYDPRKRPWYEGAVRNDGLFWTDIYILFTDRKPGVTAAHPIRGRDGGLLGVLGVDIELDALCSFLAGLEIGKTGRAVIVDNEGRIVAHPDITQTMRKEGDALRTVTVQELGDAPITRAYNRFRIEGPGVYALELDGVRYRGSATSLPDSLGTDWHVLITVPEEDYVGFVAERTRSVATMSAGLLGVLTLFAGIVVFANLRADRQAVGVLERQAELDEIGEAYLALSQDAGLLDPEDAASLRRLTETAAKATGVLRVSVWRLRGDELVCLDAYDRLGQGHLNDITLDLRCLPGLQCLLSEMEQVAAADTGDEPRLRELDDIYLSPLHHDSVIASPVVGRGKTVGLLMLEGSRLRTGWSRAALGLASSLSMLIGLRLVEGAGQHRHAKAPAPDPVTPPSQPDGDADAGDKPPAGRPLPDRSGVTRLEVQTVAEAAVLVVLCSSRRAASEQQADDPLAAGLLHEMACIADESAGRRGGVLVTRGGDRLTIASGLPGAEEGGDGKPVAWLARLALDLQQIGRRSDTEDLIAVKMGLDWGEVGVAKIGLADERGDVIGQTLRVATQLAERSSGDTVQVSGRAYQHLHDRFLLQRRGAFYTSGVGRLGMYFLSAELEESR